ncbi:MAG TPA: HD domain-containing protein [Bacteroidia bacterium]|nr:HD domain-containing protein [Bacteroidia bacterium]HNT80418.1 HD domain-containing protein [Bacteroidia bacterium]
MKRKKIFNDPVYGFISVPYGTLLQLIDHPYFQRLRRINQLGMTSLVYPGALHTRFHHALGAYHLTQLAIETLRSKGHLISEEEQEAVSIGILLHDIGHGPFSHTLESSLVEGLHHEQMSLMLMNELNKEFGGKLDRAISIFQNTYSKKFLHQLISGQLDMDRMDYLSRDSFYTGVSEGVISYERILKMLELKDDTLMVESKGIYSIEKFLIARRLMYWQVYMHKTVVAAEQMMIMIFKRAKELYANGHDLFGSEALRYFLANKVNSEDGRLVKFFAELDDFDMLSAIKMWTKSKDKILRELCSCIIDRKLYKIKILSSDTVHEIDHELDKKILAKLELSENEIPYYIKRGILTNSAYTQKEDNIMILYKNGETKDIADASDNLNVSSLSAKVSKNYVCFHPLLADLMN